MNLQRPVRGRLRELEHIAALYAVEKEIRGRGADGLTKDSVRRDIGIMFQPNLAHRAISSL